jgi:uncharacterized protein (UPF0212 family)
MKIIKAYFLILVFLFLFASAASAGEIKDVVKGMENSVVSVKVTNEKGERVSGSGFCYISSQYIVTNYHVVEDAIKIIVSTKNGKTYNVRDVYKSDKERDIAILKIAGSELTPIEKSEGVEVGEKIIVIGNPLGLSFSVSDGIVSSFRGKEASFDRAIQITAPISRGNSGGPLLDQNAKLLGITTFSFKDGQNLNFAIPAEYIEKMINPQKSETVKLTSGQAQCAECKKEIKNYDEMKFCPYCGAKLEKVDVKIENSSVNVNDRKKLFDKLLNLCRKNISGMTNFFTVRDAIKIIRTLNEINENNYIVESMLSLAYTIDGDKKLSKKYLDKAVLNQKRSASGSDEILLRAQIFYEHTFGDDAAAQNKMSAAKNREGDLKKFYDNLSEHGKDGHIVSPLSFEKVSKLKGEPKYKTSMIIGDYNFELSIYERYNEFEEYYRYLVLIFLKDVYIGQINFIRMLPSELIIRGEAIKALNQNHQEAVAAWKKLKEDPEYKAIERFFPEFDGLGWIIELK